MRRRPDQTLAALEKESKRLYALVSAEATKLHAFGGYVTFAQIGEEGLEATDVEKMHEWERVDVSAAKKAVTFAAACRDRMQREAAAKATKPVVDWINKARKDRQYVSGLKVWWCWLNPGVL